MPVNNVLYVEDDGMCLRTLQRMFQRELCPTVDTAENVHTAIDLVRKTEYGLIVSDGLEGNCFQLFEAIKGLPHGDFVIFSGDTRHKPQAEELGIPFYHKPNDLDKLVSTYKA